MARRKTFFRRLMLALLTGFVGIPVMAEFSGSGAIDWQSDLQKAHQQSVASNKPLLIVFGAKWCGYCRKLETDTLSDQQLAKYVNDSFVPLHLDLERDRRVATILEVKSVPCTIVLSPQSDLLGRLVGYVEAEKYQTVLKRTQQLQKQIELTRQTATTTIR